MGLILRMLKFDFNNDFASLANYVTLLAATHLD